jgi:D-glycero-alpha-D-manno-heptose 1-phosphate guanylyltransferase
LIKEAIILAGGLGTRLRDTVPDLPKCMAIVAGRPFLFYEQFVLHAKMLLKKIL